MPAITAADLPKPDAGDVVGTALVAVLGPWGALAAVAYKFGAPFVEKLIANSKANADPTAEEWAALTTLISTPGEVYIPKRPAP